MHQLINLLLLWQCSCASAVDRSRSNLEVKTWIDRLPSNVEGSTLQNTEHEDRQKMSHRMHSNLFDNDGSGVLPDPRIINGVSVSYLFICVQLWQLMT